MRLGVCADWDGVGVVRVLRREYDETVRTDFSQLIGTGVTIKVRRSEVPAPMIGDVLQILDDDGNPLPASAFEVAAEPMLDRRGVWACPVNPVGQ